LSATASTFLREGGREGGREGKMEERKCEHERSGHSPEKGDGGVREEGRKGGREDVLTST